MIIFLIVVQEKMMQEEDYDEENFGKTEIKELEEDPPPKKPTETPLPYKKLFIGAMASIHK